jgi:hypothetical protein
MGKPFDIALGESAEACLSAACRANGIPGIALPGRDDRCCVALQSLADLAKLFTSRRGTEAIRASRAIRGVRTDPQ